jgi:hypothetical protein
MDAAAAEAMLDVGDLEYEAEDEDTSSDDEEVVRRYLRANNGMGRRLEHPMNFKCMPSCMKKFKKCRVRCTVYPNLDRNTRCIGGHLPGKCKNNCCVKIKGRRLYSPGGLQKKPLTASNGIPGTSQQTKGNGVPGTSPHITQTFANGIPGTSPLIGTINPGVGQLPYCPNGSWHVTGMGLCMATQFPIFGVDACPSGTVGYIAGTPCVVW